MLTARASQRAFFGVSALLFAASAAVTIVWSRSMSAMGAMPMAGGWTMSMAWTRMPEQTWQAAAASFLGMWIVMMVAMMMPALLAMLRRYREAVGRLRAIHCDRHVWPCRAGCERCNTRRDEADRRFRIEVDWTGVEASHALRQIELRRGYLNKHNRSHDFW
jgi:hypothetical protein